LVFDVRELALADHVHALDARDQDWSAAEGLEAHHRPAETFDGAAILLDKVVGVLRLARLDEQAAVCLVLTMAAVLAPLLSIVTS